MDIYPGFKNSVDNFIIPQYDQSNASEVIQQNMTVTSWHLESLETPLFVQQLPDETLEQTNFTTCESMMHIATYPLCISQSLRLRGKAFPAW